MLKKLSALIGSLLMFGNSSCTSSAKDNNSNEKKNLIERLKELAGGKEQTTTEQVQIDQPMCYEPAEPAPEHKPCSVCGSDTELGSTIHYELDKLIVSLIRNGYESEEDCMCQGCLKKLIDSKKINTDLKEGEEFTDKTQYAILKVKKTGGESYHQVVITNIKNITILINFLKKQKNGEAENATAEEIAAFELLTGDKYANHCEK